MDTKELNKLLKDGEGTHIEYKEARSNMPSDLFESVCSLLNKEGGTILLGVDNDGNVTGIDPTMLEKIKRDIISSSNNTDVLNPPFTLSPQETERDNKRILYLKIAVSSQVHKHRSIIYDRENDSDLRIIDNSRISEIYFRKRTLFSEGTIYPALRMEDFELILFDKVRALIRSRKPDHPWLEEDNHGFLRIANFHKRDYATGEEGYTLAAALVFGKNEVIHNILPAYKLDAVVRIENLDRWDDRITLRTNLIDTYQQLMDFVRKNLPDKFHIEGNQRLDLRELIFREIVANIIVHREYTNAEVTNFIIYKNKVETTNPNKPHFRGILLLDEFRPFPKNPIISKFFTELGWAEEIGSGIKNVNKYLPLYVADAMPIFIEDDTFKTIIPLKISSIGDKYSLVLDFLQLSEDFISQEIIKELKGIELHSNLANIEDDDQFLLTLVSSWGQKGTKLQRLRLLPSDELPDFNKWKGLTLVEKGTKLFKKRFITIIKVLIGVLSPISLENLLSFMKYRSRSKFSEMYLNPIIKSGLVDRTIPEKPNDPNQQYIITKKGRLFLGGFSL